MSVGIDRMFYQIRSVSGQYSLLELLERVSHQTTGVIYVDCLVSCPVGLHANKEFPAVTISSL